MLVVGKSRVHQDVRPNGHEGSYKAENDTSSIPFEVIQTTLMNNSKWNKDKESYSNNNLH